VSNAIEIVVAFLLTEIVTGVVSAIRAVDDAYGCQLVFESYVFVSNGTQSDVRLIEPDWAGVQSQVVVQGAAVTD
jgi:hypothetical protein